MEHKRSPEKRLQFEPPPFPPPFNDGRVPCPVEGPIVFPSSGLLGWFPFGLAFFFFLIGDIVRSSPWADIDLFRLNPSVFMASVVG